MSRHRVLTAALIGTTLLLAGCSGGDDSPEASPTSPSSTGLASGEVSPSSGTTPTDDASVTPAQAAICDALSAQELTRLAGSKQEIQAAGANHGDPMCRTFINDTGLDIQWEFKTPFSDKKKNGLAEDFDAYGPLDPKTTKLTLGGSPAIQGVSVFDDQATVTVMTRLDQVPDAVPEDHTVLIVSAGNSVLSPKEIKTATLTRIARAIAAAYAS